MKTYLNSVFDPAEMIHVFDELPLWSAPFGLKLLDNINYRKGITALDIGFGTGFPLTELAMRLGASSVVYGIDPWKEASERARQKIRLYGIQNARIIEGVAESVPLPDDSLDLIVSNNGLNNVGNLDKALSECSRVLKSGGQFVQTMNLDGSMIEFYSELETVLLELKLAAEIKAMKQHIYCKRRPLAEISELMQKHGFLLNEVQQDQFDYRFSDATAMFNHYFIRLAFLDSWVKLLPVDRVEEIFGIIEERMNDKALLDGGMKLSIPFAILNAVKL
jgi:arsenite methyltransferase